MHKRRPSKDVVDTFIVRIYRRPTDPVEAPAGTVECVGCGELTGFIGRDQLWQRLFIANRHAHGDASTDAADESDRSR